MCERPNENDATEMQILIQIKVKRVGQIWGMTVSPSQLSSNRIARENAGQAHFDWEFIEYLEYPKFV